MFARIFPVILKVNLLQDPQSVSLVSSAGCVRQHVKPINLESVFLINRPGEPIRESELKLLDLFISVALKIYSKK